MSSGQKHSFKFDRVFVPDVSQEDVFEDISQLVQSALDGYKVIKKPLRLRLSCFDFILWLSNLTCSMCALQHMYTLQYMYACLYTYVCAHACTVFSCIWLEIW